jgi:hypothetical protein
LRFVQNIKQFFRFVIQRFILNISFFSTCQWSLPDFNPKRSTRLFSSASSTASIKLPHMAFNKFPAAEFLLRFLHVVLIMSLSFVTFSYAFARHRSASSEMRFSVVLGLTDACHMVFSSTYRENEGLKIAIAHLTHNKNALLSFPLNLIFFLFHFWAGVSLFTITRETSLYPMWLVIHAKKKDDDDENLDSLWYLQLIVFEILVAPGMKQEHFINHKAGKFLRYEI